MRAVVCRVQQASVVVDEQEVGSVERGLLAYIGVVEGDGQAQVDWMGRKLTQLRIFPDERDRMNRSLIDIGGGLLLIPNFTLAARAGSGARPSFTDAAKPDVAQQLFERLVETCGRSVPVASGRFGAQMRIESMCDGPVTLVIDTPER
jgi:D-tyrosyl-tRNA(Tyr) deacylase